MKIEYKSKNFHKESLRLIKLANEIIEEYALQGFDLSLRQLYYQFVSRNFFPGSWVDKITGSTNNENSYKKLGKLISDARLAGLISWEAIADRTRHLKSRTHWDSVSQILNSAKSAYYKDRWEGQSQRVEIWIEKDALVGVVEPACSSLDVSFFACKGYVSQSAMWRASLRLKNYKASRCIILYLGDHDPSGIDMVRDIEDRLNIFLVKNCEVRKIALTMQQVKKFKPPPNPTKLTDTRCSGYISKYGTNCWELDALEPRFIDSLIKKETKKYLDNGIMQLVIQEEQAGLNFLEKVVENSENS